MTYTIKINGYHSARTAIAFVGIKTKFQFHFVCKLHLTVFFLLLFFFKKTKLYLIFIIYRFTGVIYVSFVVIVDHTSRHGLTHVYII